MSLLDKVVAPGSRCDLNVLHRVEHRNLPNCRTITPKLIRVNDLWNIVLAEQTGEKCSGRFSITVFLEKYVEHSARIVHRSPQPMFDPTDDNVHFIQMPPGTPSGFPVAQLLGQQWDEFDVPLAEHFVADVNSSLVEELLNITLAEWEAVVEPQGIPNYA